MGEEAAKAQRSSRASPGKVGRALDRRGFEMEASNCCFPGPSVLGGRSIRVGRLVGDADATLACCCCCDGLLGLLGLPGLLGTCLSLVGGQPPPLPPLVHPPAGTSSLRTGPGSRGRWCWLGSFRVDRSWEPTIASTDPPRLPMPPMPPTLPQCCPTRARQSPRAKMLISSLSRRRPGTARLRSIQKADPGGPCDPAGAKHSAPVAVFSSRPPSSSALPRRLAAICQFFPYSSSLLHLIRSSLSQTRASQWRPRRPGSSIDRQYYYRPS
jgi:hypothetical protein